MYKWGVFLASNEVCNLSIHMFYRAKWGSLHISAAMYLIFLLDFFLFALWDATGNRQDPSRFALTSQNTIRDQVDFLLWTRENPVHAEKLNLSDLMHSTHFKNDLTTRILIHGYEDTGTTGWVLNVRNTYLQKGKNSIFFDVLNKVSVYQLENGIITNAQKCPHLIDR